MSKGSRSGRWLLILPALILAVVILSGCLGGSDERRTLTITNMDIAADKVKPATVELSITTYVENSGDQSSKNTSLHLKATDTQTKLLEASDRSDLGMIPRGETANITQKIVLPRKGGYDLKAYLYEGNAEKSIGTRTIYSLENLPVDAKEVGATVDGLEFMVMGTENKSILIQTDVRLTNLGDNISQDSDLIVKATEMDSRLTADKVTSRTGVIDPGTMVVRSVELKVPDQYNYNVEAAIWRNGTVINRGGDTLLLKPGSEKLGKEERIEETNRIETGSFIQETPAAETAAAQQTPGFEALFAGLILALLALRRRR